MFGRGKNEKMMKERKKERGVPERLKQEVQRRKGREAFQKAEPREGSRAEGVDLRARTTGQRDFTLSHPPAPQINGLQPF